MIYIYSMMLWLLLPYIFLHLFWRAFKQPEYLHHVAERFGFYSIRCNKPIIWLHAVSVGETRATRSLVALLHQNYPHHQILLTHTTPTGRAASQQLYGDTVLRVYLPYDYPFAVKKFLRCFRPQIGILLETEIWFNLIRACHMSGTPLLLLNARMSEKSARGYARFSRLTRNALSNLSAVAAQTAADGARLTSLGAKNITITGNIKFDIDPPPDMLDLGKHLRKRFGATRKIFLAASTRDGEEALLIDALQNIGIPNLLLVIVPRHPQRFSTVANLLKQHGILFQLRSELDIAVIPESASSHALSPEIQVVLGDSMGEMFAYYAAADLTFIGGSLLPYGGQNLIEACAVGTPVLIGPHTYNFSESTLLAVNAGAALQVQNINELTAKLLWLLDDQHFLNKMRQQCADFIKSNRGATSKSVKVISTFLAEETSAST